MDNINKCSCNNEYDKALKIVQDASKNIRYCYGPTGPRGEIGPTGPRGENGPVKVNVGITETIDYNEDALVSNVGTDNDVILNFKIPRGKMGDIGPTGPIGPRGLPGEIGISEVITIDGTETIEPTEEAMVQDDFDRNIHHLTFYIPKGEKGEKGDTGEKGNEGEIGPTGPKGDPYGVEAYAIRYTNTDQNFTVQEFTEAIVPLESTGPALFINYNSSYALEIRKLGVYEIHYSLSLATSTDASFNISVQSSGITVPGSNIKVSSKANTIFHISNTTIHNLLEDDEVTLVISPFDNTEFIFDNTTNASLSVIKIS